MRQVSPHGAANARAKEKCWLQALSQAGFTSSVRSVDDATGASNTIVRQKREERQR